MKAPLSYVPSLPAAIGLVTGILLNGCHIDAIWLVSLMAVGAVFSYIFRRHYISMIFLFCGIGLLISSSRKVDNLPDYLFQSPHTFSAKVGSVDRNDNSTKLIVDIDSIESVKCSNIKCQLTVMAYTPDIVYGSRIEFVGRLQSIKSIGLLPNQIDYNRYLKAEGINCKCLVNTGKIRLICNPNLFARTVNSLRDILYNGIVLSPINDNTASFLLTAILGNDSLLSNEVYDRFRTTGVAHVLALSGLHVGIIVSLLVFMLFPLRLMHRGRIFSSILTLILIWMYCIIVGSTPSVVRASVMVSVFIAARNIQNGYNAFNSLLLSIIIILCINPNWLSAPGFQLSVCAVAAILTFAPVVPIKLKRYPALYWGIMMIMVPISAMLGTGIISAYYFNSFPGMFLLSNIFVCFVFQWLLIGGVILMILTCLGIKFQLLGWSIDFLYHIMDKGVDLIASWKFCQIDHIYFSSWVILPYFACIVCLGLSLRLRNRVLGITTLCLGIITIITTYITEERVPNTELFIPSDSSSTCIVAHTGRDIWFYSDSPESDKDLALYNRLYKGYIKSRGCDSLRLMKFGQSIRFEGLYIQYPWLIHGNKIIQVIDDKPITKASNTNHGIKYALVTSKYTGKINNIIERLNPDTILLSASIHPSRRKRLIDECIAVPYKDLRFNPVDCN